MTDWSVDYLGPLTLSPTGTYRLLTWVKADADDGSITAALSLNVHAASSDALATAVEALYAACAAGNTYVHSQPGVTNPVAYVVTGLADWKLADLVSWQANWQGVSFTLRLAAQPAGALTTLYSAQAMNLPTSVSLSTLLGTHPTQLDLTVLDDTASPVHMHSVLAALAPTALSDDKWLVLASALTWTTMSSGTGATYWGNSTRYTTSSSWQTASLDTSRYPAGKYRLFARVAQEAGTGYVMDSQNQVAAPITRSTPHLIAVGDLDLPVQDTAYGTASNLTLSVRSDGTNDCTVNAFVLLPLTWGYVAWHPDVATQYIDQLDVGPTGIFMDNVTDVTYLQGGVLSPAVLATHIGTLVATASPSGSSWPTDWDKTASGVSADTSRFKCVGASKYAWYAATNAATPLIVPGQWYELSFTRDVDSYVAGNVTAQIVWQDVDGNTVRTDTPSSVAANDASPVAVTVYGKAPAHAARAQVKLGTDGTGNVTAYFSAVSLRRCPLRLILVAEDAVGTLTSYLHPVKLTLKYVPKHEVAR
jgi:hypothetical protein